MDTTPEHKKEAKPVGLVKGPGDTPHRFTFISRDSEQVLKVGEFVTYEVESGGESRTVFARIVTRVPVRRYPDSFLANPEVSPDAVGTVVGYAGVSSEIFELVAETLGYYERGFVNPRIPPAAGCPVSLGSDALLSEVLNKRAPGEVGAAEIGWLLSREKGQVPIVVDVGAIVATHMAILASTGAGKSYLAAVLIEEMLKANNRAAVIVVDPHGEYDTLAFMESHSAFSTDGYSPRVRVYKPGDVKMRYGSLTLGDLYYLLPDLSERMRYVLRRAHRQLQRESRKERSGDPDRWTFGELTAVLRAIARGDGGGENGGGDAESDADPRDKGTANALIWRLEQALAHSRLFDNHVQHELREIVQPGTCAVLQLNEVDEREQAVMVAALLRRLYEARKATHKGQASERENSAFYLPYPVFALIEEGHHFAPAQAVDAVSTGILKTILAEGRKFGVGVGLISQRPGKLNADVLSQCRTQFLMAIINPVDQERVAESVESAGREILRELPALTKGQVVVTGPAVTTPVLAQVRERHTPHGAQDPFAPGEWQAHFSEAERARQARAASAPEMRPRGRGRMWRTQDG